MSTIISLNQLNVKYIGNLSYYLSSEDDSLIKKELKKVKNVGKNIHISGGNTYIGGCEDYILLKKSNYFEQVFIIYENPKNIIKSYQKNVLVYKNNFNIENNIIVLFHIFDNSILEKDFSKIESFFFSEDFLYQLDNNLIVAILKKNKYLFFKILEYLDFEIEKNKRWLKGIIYDNNIIGEETYFLGLDIKAPIDFYDIAILYNIKGENYVKNILKNIYPRRLKFLMNLKKKFISILNLDISNFILKYKNKIEIHSFLNSFYAGKGLSEQYPYDSYLQEKYNITDSKLVDIVNSKNNYSTQLYFHFPFCFSKCNFCYIYSNIGTSKETINNYIHGLKMDFENNKSLIDNYNIDNIYLGGGTWNLNHFLLLDFIDFINSNLNKGVKEFTIELFPHNGLSKSILEKMIDSGVNCFLFGIQTFDNNYNKKYLNRFQNKKDVYRIISDMYVLSKEKEKNITLELDFLRGFPFGYGENIFLNDIKEFSDILKKYNNSFMKIFIQENNYRPFFNDGFIKKYGMNDVFDNLLLKNKYFSNIIEKNRDVLETSDDSKYIIEFRKKENSNIIAFGESGIGYIDSHIIYKIKKSKIYYYFINSKDNYFKYLINNYSKLGFFSNDIKASSFSNVLNLYLNGFYMNENFINDINLSYLKIY
ncbi:radical SAM protein [Candidatus Gracilibacteria bacterium]|nr:radical SAM protein [Candidatus Gracilibacteria bacterium]NUJ98858.1 radical SAM protein [Candidatus Gracilibacteria bacterium]